MLGKQQIAGIPTALHELFKNAYDAYADQVSVDYFRRQDILFIRDDGVGMSREDFEGRWLTLGTESKLRLENSSPPPARKGREYRPTMGEKGIGRLAIATTGKIVLILTKPELDDGSGSITVCLIHWGLFEIPGVDLDQIVIPLQTVDSISEVTKDLVESMRDELVAVTEQLSSNLALLPYTSAIANDFRSWTLPIERLQTLSGPTLTGDGSGTHFIVHPVDDELTADIDARSEKANSTLKATSLEKMLLGFSNSLTKPGATPMTANFRDHLADGETIDRIAEQQFFTPEEFELADHKVSGEFDKYGNFSGKISIYGGEYKEVKIPLFDSGAERDCGPFKLSFAYLQGTKRDTRVPSDLWEPLRLKLDKLGGLYIYRNGIRVLPFGNSDFDFLEIERRRTLSASYYFFSYRRMFGAIDITADANGNLKEKAGREGFQSNRAYRQFREQLMSFFEELAARFFREEGAYSDEFLNERTALQKEFALSQKRERQSGSRRKKLSADLEAYFSRVADEGHQKAFSEEVSTAKARVSSLVEGEDLATAADQILKIEKDLLLKLQSHLNSFRISRPSGVGLNKALARQWEQYQRSYGEDVLPHFENAKREAEATIGNIARDAKVHLDSRMRLAAALSAAEEFSEKSVSQKRKDAKTELDETSKYVTDQLRSAKEALQRTKDEVDISLSEFSFDTASDDDLDAFHAEIEGKLLEARKVFEVNLASISSQLKRIRDTGDQSEINSDATVAALETELEVLKEDYTQTLDLAQLGMAVSIVQHEFEGNVRGVRRSLQAMKRWADKNEALREIYNDIRDGFDHLDNYLSLFTPLDRRLRRRKTKITGTQISEFVQDLFGERFRRHQVRFEVTSTAAEHYLESFASVVLPVFVNLVDNAIHWLSRKDGERSIVLDSDGNSFIIRDNGPGISAMDRDLIFEFGYSKKFGGQGMGLYIAKTSLNKDLLDISLLDESRAGAVFAIGPMETKVD
ncbi:sensory histidine kinase DcuS [Sulfitobacter sp. THAF37]|nr:sensory histidine kinase DcuS [Sulfitobacter sp. THAF37]